jgi:hypothetical protein
MEGIMQSSDQNLREYYKKIEDDFNRKLFTKTNSLAFIAMVGEIMETHLDHLVATKELSKQWLDKMELPTRDSIAEVARKKIEIEDRLDRLEDQLYLSIEAMKQCRSQMAVLAWKMAELSAEFGHGQKKDEMEEKNKNIFLFEGGVKNG